MTEDSLESGEDAGASVRSAQRMSRLEIALAIFVGVLVFPYLLYALRAAGATLFEFFAVPFLVAILLLALWMAIRWREWQALTVSLLAVVVLGHFAVVLYVRCGWLPETRWTDVVSDIFRWGAFPLSLVTVAYLWRIFESDANYNIMRDSLREREREYHRIIEEASYAVIVCDTNGDIRMANPAAASLLGILRDDLETGNYFNVLPEDAATATREAIDAHQKRRTAASFDEFQHVTPNGRTQWLMQSVRTVVERGVPKQFHVILRDVTQQHRVQEASRQSEARLQTVFEAMSEGVMQTQPNGRLMFANSAALRMLRLTSERLRAGTSVDGRWSFLREDETPLPTEEWPGALAVAKGIAVRDVVVGLCHSDGSVLWMSVAAAPIMSDDEVESVVLTLRDISDRKEAEENLRLVESALDSTLEQVFLLNDQGRIIYANRQAMASLGYEADELYAKTVHDIDTELCEADWTETWYRARSGERPTFESEHTRKDGSKFPITMSASHIRHGDGEYLFAFVRDVSHETELASQLRQSQKMEAIGTLAGGIAHDFNNVLTAIIGYSELATGELEQGTPCHSYLDQVRHAADRAADMVSQILTFSRRREDERRPLILAPVVKESMKLLRGSLPPIIQVREKIAVSKHMVDADPGQVQQVVMNLCTNAYHAMRPNGGELTVTLREEEVSAQQAARHVDLREGLYARLSIADSGHGMDEETQKRMFEPFFTTKKEGEGTGLGLASVHGIVKSHQGAILVKSKIGEGTCFDIYLPAGKEIGARKEEESAEDADPTGTERVLLVDDEPQVADSLRLGLQQLGYTVEWHGPGLDALEFFRKDPDQIDIVVTDQMMPGVTGLALAADVRLLRPEMPVIIYTGFAESVSTELAECAGIKEILHKPLTAHKLALAIRRALAPS